MSGTTTTPVPSSSVLPPKTINLDTIDPLAFERLVCDLFRAMGFQADITQASRDGGIDIVAIDRRPIHGGKMVVQCKRYAGVVGASYVRDLFGVVHHEGATKGILITTSHFSPDAQAFARGKPLELVDRAAIEDLLLSHGVGVAAQNDSQHVSALRKMSSVNSSTRYQPA